MLHFIAEDLGLAPDAREPAEQAGPTWLESQDVTDELHVDLVLSDIEGLSRP